MLIQQAAAQHNASNQQMFQMPVRTRRRSIAKSGEQAESACARDGRAMW